MDVIDRDKYSYQRVKTVDSEGKVRSSASNGDAVARAMLSLTTDQLADLARANDLDMAKYKNAGLARMALSNRLRALVRKGTAVQIGEHLIKKLDQRVKLEEAPKTKAKAEKKVRRKAAANPATEDEEAA